MKFDTIIIGGGLSGLVCGIRLSQLGQRCVIISSGQSALHFSSGSFDLLNMLPGGNMVENPVESVQYLIAQRPAHPYAKLGKDEFSNIAFQAEDFFNKIGIPVKGSARKNHYRVTPLGILKPTWLSLAGFATSDSKDTLPWKKVAIFNITGFLDFYPRFIADEFLKLGTESKMHTFDIKALEHLRRNLSELRPTNIARVLDENIEELSLIINKESGDCEAVIFPACIGLSDSSVKKIEYLVKKPVLLIPTMPPSIAGIYTQQYLRKYFLNLGGVYMLGDNVRKAVSEKNKIVEVYSYNHGDIPFTGKNIVLATGSYFSQGLIATSDRVYEPIFDLDVTYSEKREDWYNPKIFEPQGYQSYGVKTDRLFRGIYRGDVIENLYVSGAILEGFNPIKEGSGAGVSILTALSVAKNIINE